MSCSDEQRRRRLAEPGQHYRLTVETVQGCWPDVEFPGNFDPTKLAVEATERVLPSDDRVRLCDVTPRMILGRWGGLMLITRSQLRAFIDAVKVIVKNGDPNAIDRVEGIIRETLKREPALKGKIDVLNAIKKEIESERETADLAKTALEFIAHKIREFQPE
jgi:hypothetical protein